MKETNTIDILPNNKFNDSSKQYLMKEIRKYLDNAENDDTTYCEILMEIPDLLKQINCD